jgi:hypothetical protein
LQQRKAQHGQLQFEKPWPGAKRDSLSNLPFDSPPRKLLVFRGTSSSFLRRPAGNVFYIQKGIVKTGRSIELLDVLRRQNMGRLALLL